MGVLMVAYSRDRRDGSDASLILSKVARPKIGAPKNLIHYYNRLITLIVNYTFKIIHLSNSLTLFITCSIQYACYQITILLYFSGLNLMEGKLTIEQ